MAQEKVLRKGVIENAEAAAHHRLAPAEHIPSKADARRKILVIRFIKPGQSTRTNRDEGAGGRIKVGEKVVLLCYYSEIVPAQTVVQRETGEEMEAVLKIDPMIVLEGVARGVTEIIKRLAKAGVQSAGQEIRKAGERQLPAKILNELG